MMYFKVKFKTNTIGNWTRYIYPKVWNSGKISVLAYEEPERKGGEQEEYCVIVVDDEYGKELKNYPEFEEITEEEANNLIKEWRKPSGS